VRGGVKSEGYTQLSAFFFFPLKPAVKREVED
jgi:hypothetical protein